MEGEEIFNVPKLMKAQMLLAIRDIKIMGKAYIRRADSLKASVVSQQTLEETRKNISDFKDFFSDINKLLFCQEMQFELKCDVYLRHGNFVPPGKEDVKEDTKYTSHEESETRKCRYSTEDEGFKSSVQDDINNDDESERSVDIRPITKNEFNVISDTSSPEGFSTRFSNETPSSSSDTEPSNKQSFKRKKIASSGEETMFASDALSWDSDSTVIPPKKKKKLTKKRKSSHQKIPSHELSSQKILIPDSVSSEDIKFHTIDPALIEIEDESDFEDATEPLYFQEDSTIPKGNEKAKNHGRRNIRKIISPEEMAMESRRAVTEQEERQCRITEREKLLSALFPRNMLVLDFNEETKSKSVQVNADLVSVLSEQQREGVKFIWNACFESEKQVKSTAGSGCIVSNYMGLGKSLQIIAICDTIIGHPVLNLNKILILCRKSDIPRWYDKFKKWQGKLSEKVEVFDLSSFEDVPTRERQLRNWQHRGGVMILGYTEFRKLVHPAPSQVKSQEHVYKNVSRHLLNPGADLVIFDENHELQNDTNVTYIAASLIRTKRRILLTGTPFQNHLVEFCHMMNLVKPFYLGDKNDFNNQFANPIMNAQFRNSTPEDIDLMKRRIGVLRQKLRGIVHFTDLKVFENILPKRHEFAIKLRMSPTQINVYRWCFENVDSDGAPSNKKGKSIEKMNLLSQVCNHPKIALEGLSSERLQVLGVGGLSLNNVGSSPKVDVFFRILNKCRENGEKLIVLSHYLQTLDLLESFLTNCNPRWQPGIDYLRLDGKSSIEDRRRNCLIFNSEKNKTARLFLLTKGVGVGLNLTGANRAIIFDAHWNPAVDTQCGFRICRFGQKKPCYIYRFIMKGTVEEKKFDQQASKLSMSTRKKSLNDPQILQYNFNYGQRTIPKVSHDGILGGLFQNTDFIDSCEEQKSFTDNFSLNCEFSSSDAHLNN